MPLLKKLKKKTEEVAKKGLGVGKKAAKKGSEVGKKDGQKGVELERKASKNQRDCLKAVNIHEDVCKVAKKPTFLPCRGIYKK